MDYRLSHLQKGEDYDESLSRCNFDSYMTERENKILLSVVPKLFQGKVPRYLDFACGTGRITQLIETMAENSYGVDVSQRMVEQARRKCTCTNFILGDITREDLGIKPVDLVTAFRFFGNAQDELRCAALRAINRLLVENGYLIFNNHRNPWTLWNTLHRLMGDKVSVDLHYHKLKHLLIESGFKITRIYGVGFWVLRDKLAQPEVLGSQVAKFLEPISKVPVLAPFCPDMVIIARKI